MFLQAALRPPKLVLDPIHHAVREALPPPAAAPPSPPPPRKGPLGRLAGRGVQVAEPSIELVPSFRLVPADQLNLPMAGFGNVTMGDANKVASGLKEEAVYWATPTVNFAGANVQEFSTHRSIVIMLDGEVDELLQVAKAVTQCVQRRGLRFDRRKFLPLLEVATIGATATSADVMAFLNALDGFQGEPWTVDHVSLMKRSFDTTSMDYLEYQTVWLGR